MPVDPDLFRGTLSNWASGVTVVTSRRGEDVRGMTASAFCSVSLDPPLSVLVCVDKSAIFDNFVAKSGTFAINMLSRDQGRDLAGLREPQGRRVAPPGGRPRTHEDAGSPVLDHAIGYLDCIVGSTYTRAATTPSSSAASKPLARATGSRCSTSAAPTTASSRTRQLP